MLLVIPYFHGDRHLAADVFAWMEEIDSYENHDLLLVRDSKCDPIPNPKTFKSVTEILVVDDIWNRWPDSCNNAIQKAARHIEYVIKKPWLFFEPDAVPIKKGWLDEIEKEYRSCGKPFMACKVSVVGVPVHGSGVGCYPPDICNHAGTLYQATDTAWDVFCSAQIIPRMHDTKLIAHRWRHPAIENQTELAKILENIGEATIFHADKSGSMIKLLRERRKPAVLPQPVNQDESTVNTSSGIGSVDIFIKTYPKDYPWLEWCIDSIKRFVTGFRKLQIISPACGFAYTFPSLHEWRELPEYGNDGYLSQQVFKMYADTFTDADHILHLDSDTIFIRPVTPETYFTNVKINWLISPYDKVNTPWKPITEKFLGRTVEFEFMRRMPFVLPRWIYPAIREFCEKQHGMTLDKYIMSQPSRAFSEFNAIGAFAYYFHHDKFNWINTEEVPEKDWPELTVDQRFSHDPIPVEEWEKILTDGHGDNKTLASDISPVIGDTSASPKPVSQTTLEKRRAALVKARAAKAAKRLMIPDPNIKGVFWTDNHPLRYEHQDGEWVQINPEYKDQEPWEDKFESLGEINKLVQRLYKFCDAPSHVHRVREELKKVGVIR